jgi:peptidoglycan/LPS O-acetylase OafA/YrhL
VAADSDYRYALGYALTMTQSWVYELVEGVPVHELYWGINWSISTEIFFYLSFPILSLLVWRITRLRSAILLLAASFVAFYGYQYAIYALRDGAAELLGRHFADIAAAAPYDRSFGRWLAYFSPYGRLPEFVTGCLTARLAQLLDPLPVSTREARWGAAAASLICALIAATWLAFGTVAYAHAEPRFAFFVYLHQNYLLAPLIASLILCVTRYRSWVATLLGCAPFVYLGEISYSLYLSHPMIPNILRAFRIYYGNSELSVAHYLFILAMGLATTAIVSVGTYTVIEAPFRTLIRRALRTRTLVAWRRGAPGEAAAEPAPGAAASPLPRG